MSERRDDIPPGPSKRKAIDENPSDGFSTFKKPRPDGDPKTPPDEVPLGQNCPRARPRHSYLLLAPEEGHNELRTLYHVDANPVSPILSLDDPFETFVVLDCPRFTFYSTMFLVYDKHNTPYYMQLLKVLGENRLIKKLFFINGWSSFVKEHKLGAGDHILFNKNLDSTISDDFYYILMYVKKPESSKKPGDSAESSREPGDGAESSRKPDDGVESSREPVDGAERSRKLDDGAESSRKPGDGAESSRKPGDGAESSRKLDDGAESSRKPGDGAESSRKPGDGAESSRKPGDGAESSRKLGDGAESTRKPGDGAENSRKLGDGADSSRKPGDGAESSRKLDDGAESSRKPGDGAESSRKPSGDSVQSVLGTGMPAFKVIYHRVLLETPSDQEQRIGPRLGSRPFQLEAICLSKTLNVAELWSWLYFDVYDAIVLTDNPRITKAPPGFSMNFGVLDRDNRQYQMTLRHFEMQGGIFGFCLDGWDRFIMNHDLKQGDRVAFYKFLDRRKTNGYYYVVLKLPADVDCQNRRNPFWPVSRELMPGSDCFSKILSEDDVSPEAAGLQLKALQAKHFESSMRSLNEPFMVFDCDGRQYEMKLSYYFNSYRELMCFLDNSVGWHSFVLSNHLRAGDTIHVNKNFDQSVCDDHYFVITFTSAVFHGQLETEF